MRDGGLFPASALALGPHLAAVPLGAEHFFAIAPQHSQRTQYGIAWSDMEWSAAEHMAAQPGCFAVIRGATEVLAIFGINETFPGRQGVAFAIFGERIGLDHHVLTRFARDEVIGRSPLPRLEAIVRCIDLEPALEVVPDASPAMLLTIATRRVNLTPQVRFALAVGFTPAAVLRKFGAASETHMLLERIR